MDHEEIRGDLGIGAGPPTGTVPIVYFVPSQNRFGESIDQEFWRKEVLSELGRLFRGATALPPGLGVWRDDQRGGELLFEETALVFSIASPNEVTAESMQSLGNLARRFGREAGQGEVGLWIDGFYHPITQFDDE